MKDTVFPAIQCSHNAMVPVSELKPHPKNPNTHPSKQILLLAKVIKEQGFRLPILVSKRSGFIVAGHGRLSAAKVLGMDFVPVDYQDFDSEEAEMAHLVADNRLAELSEIDKEALGEILDALKEEDFDLELAGFEGKAVEDLADALSTFEGTSDELPGGVVTFNPDAGFQSDEIFGIPPFLANKAGDAPEGMQTWAGPDVTEKADFYLWNYNTDSTRGMPWERSIISFWCEDHRFAAAWDNSTVFATKLINKGALAVISPNFSTWDYLPEAAKIWAVYRSRWCARFWQEAGLLVIPDVQFIRGKDGKLADYAYAGIPKGLPCVAVQQHTSTKDEHGLLTNIEELRTIESVLAPRKILVYAGDNTEKAIELAGIATPIQKLTCRVSVRRPKMDSKTKEK